jgi:hypothetical protein
MNTFFQRPLVFSDFSRCLAIWPRRSKSDSKSMATPSLMFFATCVTCVPSVVIGFPWLSHLCLCFWSVSFQRDFSRSLMVFAYLNHCSACVLIELLRMFPYGCSPQSIPAAAWNRSLKQLITKWLFYVVLIFPRIFKVFFKTFNIPIINMINLVESCWISQHSWTWVFDLLNLTTISAADAKSWIL